MKLYSLCILIILAVLPLNAFAYQILGKFGSSCHEDISMSTFLSLTSGMAKGMETFVEIPDDDATQRLISSTQKSVHDRGYDVDDPDAFILMSFIIGVRAPDSDGHASTNLAHTRAEHANNADDAQYIHFLRGKSDDYQEGNNNAARNSRALFKELLRTARTYRSISQTTFNIDQTVFIDFYGMVDIKVNAVAYYIGMAAHQLADSFSHTIRSEADNFEKIISIMNYVEAIYPGFDEERDGLRHSDYTDDCRNKDNAPIVTAAMLATSEYGEMVMSYISTGDESYIDQFSDKWFQVREDCYNDFALCHSEHWLEVAKKDETHPYLECAQNIYRNSPVPAALIAVFGAAFLAVLYRRRKHS